MEIMEYGNGSSDIVLVQMVDGHDHKIIEREYELIRESTDVDFLLRACAVSNWNADLSPWKAPAVFGKEDFGGMAEETLDAVLDICADNTKMYYIGGYSLAGLFALWSAYRTDIFRGVAAASPSIWFPGFSDHMASHDITCERVYLSLGDREAKVRNPVVASVAGKIREAYDLLRDRNITCILEWNEGNHFREPDVRCARAFSWVLQAD